MPIRIQLSASVIQHVGAKIVMVDVQPDSYEMDYEKTGSGDHRKNKSNHTC